MIVHLNVTGNRSLKMVIITYCKSQKRILVAPKTSRLKKEVLIVFRVICNVTEIIRQRLVPRSPNNSEKF